MNNSDTFTYFSMYFHLSSLRIIGNWNGIIQVALKRRKAWEDELARILIVMTKGRSAYPTADTYSTTRAQTLLTSA